MAGRAISIDILANVRDALKGTGDVEKALGDIESTLEDMAREGDQSTDKMSRGFRDLAQDADRSADKVEDSYRAAFKDVARKADDAADSAVRSQSRIGERSAEVRDEVRQNLGEGIANAARGDFESLSDTIGDTLGGAVAGIGGLAAAGLAAAGALGLGAIVGVIKAQQEEANKLKERLTEAYQAAAESGLDYIDTAAVIANQNDLMFNPERANEWAKVQETQKTLGLEWSTVLKANAGDLDALAIVQDRVAEANKDAADAGEEANVFLDAQGTKTQQLKDYWNQLGTVSVEQDKARQASIERTTELLAEEINTTKGVVVEVDNVGNSLYTLPSGKQILVSAETGQATTNISEFKGDVDGVPKTVTTTVRVNVDDYNWRMWRPQVKNGYVVSTPYNGRGPV